MSTCNNLSTFFLIQGKRYFQETVRQQLHDSELLVKIFTPSASDVKTAGEGWTQMFLVQNVTLLIIDHIVLIAVTRLSNKASILVIFIGKVQS